MELRHKVCIIGAGPAGLVLANILNNAGIDCIVLDRRGRDEITKCHRAGLIDHRSVLALKKHNLAQGLLQYGQPHTICEFRMGQVDFLLEYTQLSGGAMHYIYPQQELIKDLIQSFEQAHGTIELFLMLNNCKSTDFVVPKPGGK
jgi:p-hydroxybenzoate 3-monooxygenase